MVSPSESPSLFNTCSLICYTQVLSIAYLDFVSAFEEQGRRVLAKRGLLCLLCHITDIAAGPPPLSEEGGDCGGSDLVLTQENKPKARPIV